MDRTSKGKIETIVEIEVSTHMYPSNGALTSQRFRGTASQAVDQATAFRRAANALDRLAAAAAEAEHVAEAKLEGSV